MNKGGMLALLCWLVACVPVLASEQGIVRVDPVAVGQVGPALADDAAPRRAAMITNGDWQLQPVAGVEQPLLLVYHPYSARVTVATAPGIPAQTQTLFDRGLDPQYSRHALVFPLRGDGPVQVKVEGARYPLQLAVLPRATHIARDLTEVRVVMLSVGVLVGVSLTVLLFWAMLGERVYLLYSVSMALQLLYLLSTYGEAYALPGLRWLAAFGTPGIWFIATVATMSAVYLLLDYAGLRTRTPRLSIWLRWVGIYLPGLLLLLLMSPWPAGTAWFPNSANVLFLLTNLLAITGLLVAWRGGGRHAGFVLIAWVPMVVFSTARAVQLSMGIPIEPWLQYGLPLVLAFVAVVLALGLADRMLTFRRERDTAQEHAERDWLTGVLNRAGIEHRLDWAILNARREQAPLSLLFLDLDDFKRVNDRHGHAVGDNCLRAVVRAVSEELHYGDHLGRLGGEEFVLGLPGADRSHSLAMAERLRHKVETTCREVDGAEVAVTVSIGVAECNDSDTVATLIQRADTAMYVAKHGGRNRVVMEEVTAI